MADNRPLDALPEGARVGGYVIGRVLGRGGFGVTYAASNALFPDAKVAIKEFFPANSAMREPGGNTIHPTNPERKAEYRKNLAAFEAEARTLAALRHPNIVEVQAHFEDNGTAYVVMKFEEGKSLDKILAGKKTLSEAELMEILPPLLDGVEAVHAAHYLHRDIKPANILRRAADGTPSLLDFGAARQAIGQDRKASLTEIVTPGYAPFEQYFRKGEQGPWSDIYALGATFYRCLFGEAPSA
jgi:serine/threonine protein kinase